MKELKTIPELENFFPPLSEFELDRLHTSLLTAGRAKVPIIVWRDKDIIIDGHNRYAFCIENNLEFEIRYERHHDLESAKLSMINHQFDRRNLSDKAQALFRGKWYNRAKGERGGNNPDGVGGKSGKKPLLKDQSDTLTNSAETIAEQTGKGVATIKRDGEFADAVEELGIEADVISGKDERSRAEIVEDAKAIKDNGDKDSPPKKKKPAKPRSKRPKDMPDKAWEVFKPIATKDSKKRTKAEKVVYSFGRLPWEDQQSAIKIIDNLIQD